ncbi:hypothetical protein QO010_004534 [Caulobacter ginsengisoli]|uniref:DNA methylase N-4/N-6 domain-containing protein n=1 Tax=Caulobacter ginsengisoli TaxID=400775 RepID=A0ABU0IZY6_9CAUL|nr:hypothetical protein [Caulobacter ginsengisoli]MDQ0466738.1 hypothetical protein [Caulobacter ginsengisoli]
MTIAEFDPHVRFEDWTRTRVPAVIGTNSGSEPLAFQNWRRFKEAFVPELVERAVRETGEALGRPVINCLDPCAGSGTTPLACQFLGVEPIAIEVNPFLADLIEAKLSVVDAAVVARRCSEVIGTQLHVDPNEHYALAPATFVEPGVADRYLFPRDVAERLANLVLAVEQVPEVKVKRLLRVLLGSAALEVCNATVSGKGRRYRQNWKEQMRTVDELDQAFVQAVEGAVFDIARYARRRNLSYDLRRGDARLEIANIPEIDLAVFSPPYPNSFDYTDVYNIELWSLGYLKGGKDNVELRNSTLRSHVQIKRDFASDGLSLAVRTSVSKLRAVDGLWNKNIPDMIGAYFADLAILLRGVREKLVAEGRVYMVVGDSRYAGVDVPVAEAIAEMAPSLRYELIGSEPFRSMRVSPQQGGRAELAETLIVLAAV